MNLTVAYLIRDRGNLYIAFFLFVLKYSIFARHYFWETEIQYSLLYCHLLDHTIVLYGKRWWLCNEGPMLIYVLRWWPSWISDRHIKQISVEDLPMIIPGQFGFNCPSGFREEAFWNIFPTFKCIKMYTWIYPLNKLISLFSYTEELHGCHQRPENK